MSSPQVSTSEQTSTHLSISRPRLSAYERVLASAVAGAVALVAGLAWSLPAAPSVSTDATDGTVVSAAQVARGKATLPGSATQTSPDSSLLP